MTRERLYQAYINELKFYNPILKTQSKSDIIAGYKQVSAFSDLTWFDLYDGPEIVGFLLVVTGAHCTVDADYFIMELYVHPNHRGKGIATRAVSQLIKENPGNVGLYILNLNIDAHKFWNRIYETHKDCVVKLNTNGQYDDSYGKYQLWSVKVPSEIGSIKNIVT